MRTLQFLAFVAPSVKCREWSLVPVDRTVRTDRTF